MWLQGRLFEQVTSVFRSLRRDAGGGLAMPFAAGLTAMALTTGAAVDFAAVAYTRSDLQQVADSAALAGAAEFRLAGASGEVVAEVARSHAESLLRAEGGTARVAPDVDPVTRSVTVRISDDVETTFMMLAGIEGVPVEVSATARAAGSNAVCLLALSPDGSSSLLVDLAKVTAPGCSTQTNSHARDALAATRGSAIQSKVICSGGGAVGPNEAFDPAVTLDCAPAADPLAGRQAPAAARCDHQGMRVIGGSRILQPGVYCGGLRIGGHAKVTFAHGIYVVRGGPLELTHEASLTMTDATIHLVGPEARLVADYSTSLDLSASTSGPMAGILIFEDRSAPVGRVHQIGSRNAARLLGTIYMPRGKLIVGEIPNGILGRYDCSSIANCPIRCPPPSARMADKSAWTLVIAREVVVNAGINLVLNTNYEGSTVPPPTEVVSSAVVLSD